MTLRIASFTLTAGLAVVLAVVGLAPRATALSAAGRMIPPSPVPANQVIDVHCHTAGIGAGGSGCFVTPRLVRSFRYWCYLRAFGVTRRELEKEGDALIIARISARLAESRRVGRAVVLALDGVVDARGELDRVRTEVYVPNEFVAEEVAKHPNLLFGASINPYRADALERLDWAKRHGAVLVKWLPPVQLIDPADPRLIPFYRRMAALGLPLLTHTGTEHAFTRSEEALADPERLRLPLSLGVTVIAAHAATTGTYGGERGLERLVRLMREYPRLYADVSSLTQLNKRADLPELLRRPEFNGRLLYGTDYPLVNIRLLVSSWYHLSRLGWSVRRAVDSSANPWDRDVALKSALGLPADAWTRANTVLALPPTRE